MKPVHFDNISQRVLWGYQFAFSEFTPVVSELADEKSQAALHTKLKSLLNLLYENPAILHLPMDEDQAYDWFICNNQLPELNELYLDVNNKIYSFFRFLFVTASNGTIQGPFLTIHKQTLKQNKTSYKNLYSSALQAIGIECTADHDTVTLSSDDKGILHAFFLLTQRKNLFDFVRCSYDGSYNYLIDKIDQLYDYNGFLHHLTDSYLKRGYVPSFCSDYGKTAFAFNIQYQTSDSNTGFKIVYINRKKDLFRFGTMSGVGEKAMLEDFDHLDPILQKHFVDICRPCSHCLGCTKGGKSKIFTVSITYQGETRALCPQFPQHDWEYINPELANALSIYLETQKKYI